MNTKFRKRLAERNEHERMERFYKARLIQSGVLIVITSVTVIIIKSTAIKIIIEALLRYINK